jgi:exonuclease SbcD
VVNVVDARPGLPAEVTAVPLTAGRRLRTVRGTLVDVLAAAGAGVEGGDHLRVVLDEPARAGLADEVRERMPDAVEVVLAPRDAERAEATAGPERLRHTPQDLFREYLAERDAADERVIGLFDELVDELAAEP